MVSSLMVPSLLGPAQEQGRNHLLISQALSTPFVGQNELTLSKWEERTNGINLCQRKTLDSGQGHSQVSLLS